MVYTYQEDIVRQPADRERYDYSDHHFYHLQTNGERKKRSEWHDIIIIMLF